MKLETVILAFSIALFLTPIGTAAEFSTDEAQLEEYKQTVNNNSDQLPDFVKDLVGDQDINVYLDSNKSESYNLSLQMEGTDIETIENESLGNPDLEVWTSTRVLENISASNEPVERMKTAINKDDIEYQANDTWTKIRVFFAETFMNVF